MKIYIVTKEPFPNGMAATNRIKCYARAIKEGGLECEVIVCGCTEMDQKNIRNTQAEGFYEGVPFRYIGGTTTDTRSKPIRLFSQFLKLLRTGAFFNRNLKKGDILFFNMIKQINWVLYFMAIARRHGAYCVSDLCELPYGTSIETSSSRHFRKITTDQQFPLLDGIICISDALLDFAKPYTQPSCKFIKVPILVEFDRFQNQIDIQKKISDVPYIFHSGTLTEQKDGILGMIEAFGMAIKKMDCPVRFICTGNKEKSIFSKEIDELIEKYELADKLLFTGFIGEDVLKDYLQQSSVVIINKYPTQQNLYCFSTKLGEYMAARKPVIITNVGEAMNWLTDKETAYIVEPENVEILADTIVHAFLYPEESRKIGLEGQALCRRCFDYHNWSRPMVSFFMDLKNCNPSNKEIVYENT